MAGQLGDVVDAAEGSSSSSGDAAKRESLEPYGVDVMLPDL